MTSCDPQDLMAAARCFRCIPAGMMDEVIMFLLCQIANVSLNSQTCLVCIAADGAPTERPTCDCAIAYNDIGQFWFWSASRNSWTLISV